MFSVSTWSSLAVVFGAAVAFFFAANARRIYGKPAETFAFLRRWSRREVAAVEEDDEDRLPWEQYEAEQSASHASNLGRTLASVSWSMSLWGTIIVCMMLCFALKFMYMDAQSDVNTNAIYYTSELRSAARLLHSKGEHKAAYAIFEFLLKDKTETTVVDDDMLADHLLDIAKDLEGLEEPEMAQQFYDAAEKKGAIIVRKRHE